MPHNRGWPWVLVFLFFFSQTVSAASSKNDLIAELFVKSGMDRQLQQMPLVFQAGFDQAVNNDDRLLKLPKHILSSMRELIVESYATSFLEKIIKEQLAARLTENEIRDVLKWLQSPLGKKCSQLEEAASTPEAITQMQAYAGQFQHSPPPQKRLKLIQQLDSATKATETAVEVAMNTQLSVAIAVVLTLPKENQKPILALKKEIEQTRSQLERIMRTQILISFLYTYRSLTESELEQYLKFTASTVGEKYNLAGMNGFKKGLLEGSIKWGKAIAKVLENITLQSEI